MTHALIRLTKVQALTGLSRAQLYRLESHNEFPKRITISKRAVAWVREEVDSWIRQRIRESRGGGLSAPVLAASFFNAASLGGAGFEGPAIDGSAQVQCGSTLKSFLT